MSDDEEDEELMEYNKMYKDYLTTIKSQKTNVVEKNKNIFDDSEFYHDWTKKYKTLSEEEKITDMIRGVFLRFQSPTIFCSVLVLPPPNEKVDK